MPKWSLASLVVLGFSCNDSLRLVLVEAGGGTGLSLGGASAGSSDGGKPSTLTEAVGGTPSGGQGDAGAAQAGEGGEGSKLPWEADTLYLASYESMAYPGSFMRRVQEKGFITPVDVSSQLDRDEATFEMIPGLYDVRCVTFRAQSRPINVFRHAGSRLYLHAPDLDDLFLADATFCEEAGLGDPEGISFRSVNYPQRVIHVRNENELWIDDLTDTPEFAAEATFYRVSPLSDYSP